MERVRPSTQSCTTNRFPANSKTEIELIARQVTLLRLGQLAGKSDLVFDFAFVAGKVFDLEFDCDLVYIPYHLNNSLFLKIGGSPTEEIIGRLVRWA